MCKEGWIWTYAQIRGDDNEVGWSWIRVRGSCGCAIWPAEPSASSIDWRGNRLTPVARGNGRRSYASADHDDPFL